MQVPPGQFINYQVSIINYFRKFFLARTDVIFQIYAIGLKKVGNFIREDLTLKVFRIRIILN